MAHWHGLAKLRLHTDYTLAHLERATTELGEQLRVFQRKTCAAYKTGELPRETAARNRRKAKAQVKKSSKAKKLTETPSNPKTKMETPSDSKPTTETPLKPKPKQRVKLFNLNTYKTHALGDYVETIRRYGTADSFSTEMVSKPLNKFIVVNLISL